MSQFPVHTLASAPQKSRPALEGLNKTFGFVPNLYATFAESPAVLQGALALSQAFGQTSLTPAEQQVVALATSVANDCGFCVAAHSTIARHLVKVPSPVVDALRADAVLPDAKLQALATFVRRTVATRGWTEPADLEAFLAAGYTRAQALEVLLGVGMKIMNNYIDHLTHIPLNEQFKGEAWSKEQKKVA